MVVVPEPLFPGSAPGVVAGRLGFLPMLANFQTLILWTLVGLGVVTGDETSKMKIREANIAGLRQSCLSRWTSQKECKEGVLLDGCWGDGKPRKTDVAKQRKKTSILPRGSNDGPELTCTEVARDSGSKNTGLVSLLDTGKEL